MKIACKHPFALLCAALLIVVCASNAKAQAGASDDDKKFVDAALKGGMAEIDLGKLAEKKGASEDVKQFGQMMVTDHTRLGEKMKTVAGEIGVKPPTMTTASDMAEKAELDVLSGKAFDEAYIKHMVKDHEDDLADFKKEEANTTSPAVKRVARHGEMVITKHLEAIKKIAAAHNVDVS